MDCGPWQSFGPQLSVLDKRKDVVFMRKTWLTEWVFPPTININRQESIKCAECESHVFHPVSFEVKSDTEMRTMFKVFFVLIRSRGRGRLWDGPPGLLWGVPARRRDHPLRHLSPSIPHGLFGPWHGEGPWGHLELPPLCKHHDESQWEPYSTWHTVAT